MKTRAAIVLLFIALGCLCLRAQLNIGNPFFVAGVLVPAVASGPTYLFKQSFETTGAPCYDNSETWTESGVTINTNTDFASLGSRCLALRHDSGSTPSSKITNFTATTAFSLFFSFATTTNLGQQQILATRSNGLDKASIYLRATSKLAIYDENTFFQSSPVGTLPTNTTVYIWADFNFGTLASGGGTNMICWSTTTTKPNGGVNWTNGTGSTNMTVSDIEFIAPLASSTNYFDYARGDDVIIGSAPQ